jgi:hypothetical protein
MFIFNELCFFIGLGATGGENLRGDMKQFYIIMSTIGAFVAMDFIYTGEFPPSCFGGIKDN